jgi:hypothetical protein
MFPTQNSSVVSKGLAYFTSAFTQDLAPNLRALASVYLTEVQAIENAVFAVIEGRWLANAVGVDLDVIGGLVGQPRDTLDDGTYKAAIRLRIKANASGGTTGDVSALGQLIAAKLTSDLSGVSIYQESGVAAWSVTISNMLYPLVAAPLLSVAGAIGTRGSLIYSTWAPGDDFSCTSVYDGGVSGEAGFSSVYSTSTGGLLLTTVVT